MHLVFDLFDGTDTLNLLRLACSQWSGLAPVAVSPSDCLLFSFLLLRLRPDSIIATTRCLS